MELQTTTKLPSGKAVIGVREIMKSIKAGKAKKIVFASNCPDFLVDKIKDLRESQKLGMEKFAGDSRELGTKLGKPFPVSMVAFS